MHTSFLLVLPYFRESHCKQDLPVYWSAGFDRYSAACFTNYCQGLKLNKSQANRRLFKHGRGAGRARHLRKAAASYPWYQQNHLQATVCGQQQTSLARRRLLWGGSWGPLPLTVSGGPLGGGVLPLAWLHREPTSQRTSQCKLPIASEWNQANMEKPNRLHLLINYGLPIHKPAVLGRFKTKPCALAFYFLNNAISCCVCFNSVSW